MNAMFHGCHRYEEQAQSWRDAAAGGQSSATQPVQQFSHNAVHFVQQVDKILTISQDVVDNHEEAAQAAPLTLKLCQMVSRLNSKLNNEI